MTVPGLQNAASATVALVAVSTCTLRSATDWSSGGCTPAGAPLTALQLPRGLLAKGGSPVHPLHTYETDQQVTCSSDSTHVPWPRNI